ncbi:MAG: hypothetical protein AAF740_01365 [Bacteroidota bacterium]
MKSLFAPKSKQEELLSSISPSLRLPKVTFPKLGLWHALNRMIGFCEENLSVVSLELSIFIKVVFIATLWWKLSSASLGIFTVAFILLVILETAFTLAALVTAKLREDSKHKYSLYIEGFKAFGILFNQVMIGFTMSASDLYGAEMWMFGFIMTSANIASYFMAESAGYLNHKEATKVLSQGSQPQNKSLSQGSQVTKSQKKSKKDVYLTIDGKDYTELQINSQITTNFGRLREAAKKADHERVGVLCGKIKKLAHAIENQHGEPMDGLIHRMEKDARI